MSSSYVRALLGLWSLGLSLVAACTASAPSENGSPDASAGTGGKAGVDASRDGATTAIDAVVVAAADGHPVDGKSSPDTPPATDGPGVDLPRVDGARADAVTADTGGTSSSCLAGGSGFDTSIAGVALDRKTCLAWERQDPDRDDTDCAIKDPSARSKLCWAQAVKYCGGLRLDNKADWRLPTSAELQTIVVLANYPAADKAIFPDTLISLYWTSEMKGEKIVGLDFGNAGMLNDHVGADGPQAFRCVRHP